MEKNMHTVGIYHALCEYYALKVVKILDTREKGLLSFSCLTLILITEH